MKKLQAIGYAGGFGVFLLKMNMYENSYCPIVISV